VAYSCFASTIFTLLKGGIRNKQAIALDIARAVTNLVEAERGGVGHVGRFDIIPRQSFGLDYAEKLGPRPTSQQLAYSYHLYPGAAEQRSFSLNKLCDMAKYPQGAASSWADMLHFHGVLRSSKNIRHV
jgi:hypothetical protein